MLVNRVERHIVKKSHKLYSKIDQLSFTSKNLYNYANYLIRQTFIITSRLNEGKDISEEQQEFLRWINLKVDSYNVKREMNCNTNNKTFKLLKQFDENHKYLGYNFLEYLAKENENYKLLMAQVSQQVLRVLDKNWISFFNGIKKWSKCKDGFTGRPKLPKYKSKNGRNNICFTNQNCHLVNNAVKFPKCLDQFELKTKVWENLQQVRIKPTGSNYVIEIVYQKVVKQADHDSKSICGIDLGINNFVTIANNTGALPVIINGKIIKSINQYYNKQLAKLKSDLKKRHKKDWSARLQRLTDYRNNRICDFIHKTSRWIINYCLAVGIDTVVVGKNDGWKNESKMSRKTNQHFVQIPHAEFISKLTYKCEDSNIKLVLTEESYTSGTSYLDGELPVKESYNKKRRIKRGLFRSNENILINADLNASYQIMRKVFPNVCIKTDGIEGVGLHPVRVRIA